MNNIDLPKNGKITPEISLLISKLMTKKSLRQICDEIHKQFDVEITPPTVNKHIKMLQEQSSEEAQRYRFELQMKNVTTDVERLEHLIKILTFELEDPNLKLNEKNAIIDRILKITDMKMKHLGIDQDDNELIIKWDIGTDEDDPEPEPLEEELEIVDDQ